MSEPTSLSLARAARPRLEVLEERRTPAVGDAFNQAVQLNTSIAPVFAQINAAPGAVLINEDTAEQVQDLAQAFLAQIPSVQQELFEGAVDFLGAVNSGAIDPTTGNAVVAAIVDASTQLQATQTTILTTVFLTEVGIQIDEDDTISQAAQAALASGFGDTAFAIAVLPGLFQTGNIAGINNVLAGGGGLFVGPFVAQSSGLADDISDGDIDDDGNPDLDDDFDDGGDDDDFDDDGGDDDGGDD